MWPSGPALPPVSSIAEARQAPEGRLPSDIGASSGSALRQLDASQYGQRGAGLHLSAAAVGVLFR